MHSVNYWQQTGIQYKRYSRSNTMFFLIIEIMYLQTFYNHFLCLFLTMQISSSESPSCWFLITGILTVIDNLQIPGNAALVREIKFCFYCKTRTIYLLNYITHGSVSIKVRRVIYDVSNFQKIFTGNFINLKKDCLTTRMIFLKGIRDFI